MPYRLLRWSAIICCLLLPLNSYADEEVQRVWKEKIAKAEAGDPKIQTEVGLKLFHGDRFFVPDHKRDLEAGWKWLERASLQGYKPAQEALYATKYGHYQSNRGLDRDELIFALMWYCIFKGKLVTDFEGVALVSDETIGMVHAKVELFWKKHPELKK
jgi:TPR repeat protein